MGKNQQFQFLTLLTFYLQDLETGEFFVCLGFRKKLTLKMIKMRFFHCYGGGCEEIASRVA